MGQNQVLLRHQKFTFPWAREWAKWAVRANERTDERGAQYLSLYSCLFQTTVRRSPDLIVFVTYIWKFSAASCHSICSFTCFPLFYTIGHLFSCSMVNMVEVGDTTKQWVTPPSSEWHQLATVDTPKCKVLRFFMGLMGFFNQFFLDLISWIRKWYDVSK